MKAILAVLMYVVLVGCVHTPEPQARFWVEPSDPDVRLKRDEQFLQKSKMSQSKKKIYPGTI